MGRIVGFELRRRKAPGSSLPEVTDTIATLDRELAFTLAFVDRMLREGNLETAVRVIDEQRLSLREAVRDVDDRSGLAARVKRRAAAVGLAAAVVLGSGAFAAFGPGDEPPAEANPVVGTIGDLIAGFEAAAAGTADEETRMGALLDRAGAVVRDLPPGAIRDPEVRDGLDNLRDRLVDYAPHAPSGVTMKATSVAFVIEEVMRPGAERRADLPQSPLR